MIVAVGALLIVVAAGRGGYAPWATFVLEIGAAWLLAGLSWRGSSLLTLSLSSRRLPSSSGS